MFVAIEGIDGAGKTGLIAGLKLALEAAGRQVLIVREPGGLPAAEVVRSVLKDPSYIGQIPPIAELLLFYASRSMLVETVIKPALENGTVVIADRFELSTFAYQGIGLGLMEECIVVSKQTLKGFCPDLYLWIDADPEVCLERRKAASGEFDSIEARGVEFFKKCRRGFATAETFLETTTVRLNGNASKEQVLEEALGVLNPLLLEKQNG